MSPKSPTTGHRNTNRAVSTGTPTTHLHHGNYNQSPSPRDQLSPIPTPNNRTPRSSAAPTHSRRGGRRRDRLRTTGGEKTAATQRQQPLTTRQPKPPSSDHLAEADRAEPPQPEAAAPGGQPARGTVRATPNHSSRAKRRRQGVRVAQPPLAASAALPHKRRRRGGLRFPQAHLAHRLRGRYWDRTSDLFRVREARYRCANRPKQTTHSTLRAGEGVEVETGFEPVYTALQAVASPLGHSTSEKAWPAEPSPSGRPGSNRRPQPWQGCALPTELRPHRSGDCFRSVREQNSSALFAHAKTGFHGVAIRTHRA
jgi:hypothetical protein